MTGRLFRYAGPDGERLAALPAGEGAALGSEYCVHLLPDRAALRSAAESGAERRIPLLLLTPYFRDRELKAFVGLLRELPPGADLEVVVNDWGALLAVRTLFPGLRLSVGRLLSGQKKCPRIPVSKRLTPEERGWHGQGLFSSDGARRYLLAEFGIDGYHVDPVEWGLEALAEAARDPGGGAVRLFVHAPYGIVTVSDSCPWIGGLSSASVASCPRHCRRGAVALREPSMGPGMIQRGKARFAESAGRGGGGAPDGFRADIVLYDEIP